MAPEKAISPEQEETLINWVVAKSGGILDSCRTDTYTVDNEILVISNNNERRRVDCSDKHAQELEKAGIVNFSEVTEKVG